MSPICLIAGYQSTMHRGRACVLAAQPSLIRLLNHAATVVRPGRTFLRSLIDASTTVEHLDHRVTLHAHVRADIICWCTFVNRWNGILFLPEADPSHQMPQAHGALYEQSWFQLQWQQSWNHVHIAAKELVPIVVPTALWGYQWTGRHVCCYCETIVVIFAINKGSAGDPQLMRLLRTRFSFFVQCMALHCQQVILQE